ncbi:MAG TPA: hypothetical protein VGW35_05600 [Methylomirabilota bacterium]|nr:hypothetical protein [Methylomirabilota bacterium]HEV8672804.1 hypothetical protein [Methylomirabilota bacterium]
MVIAGVIQTVDRAGRIVLMGSARIRVPEAIALENLDRGVSVTITCAERDGDLWAIAVRRNTF